MKFLSATIHSSLWEDLSKSRAIGSYFTTTRAKAVKTWLESKGHEVDMIYNDVGWTEKIKTTEYDVLVLHVCGGFVCYGGHLSKWHYQLLTYLADHELEMWVVHDDCEYPVVCGAGGLRKSLPNLVLPAGGDRAKVAAGIDRFEQMFAKEFPVIMPGGHFDLKTKKTESLAGRPEPVPEINYILAHQTFPNIPPLEEPTYDVVYAGLFRKGRQKVIQPLLDDPRFSSASVCTGTDAPGKVVTSGLNIQNHVEISGFRYEDQQHWYNNSLAQLIVTDEKNYGRFMSARWFSALRTNSAPLVYAPTDPNRELFREDLELSFLYVETSDDVWRAVQELKVPERRKDIVSRFQNLEHPWFCEKNYVA